MKATYKKYILHFKVPGGTSRGILKTKETWLLYIYNTSKWGIGECGLFKGLSADDLPDYEEKLKWVCDNINKGKNYLLSELTAYPSIQFGIEQAFMSFLSHNPFELFSSSFISSGDSIPINGLIWMGDEAFMRKQIREKIANGFKCIKIKIGAIDFETELELIKSIRKNYSVRDIEIRVDANGAFTAGEALEKLKRLSEFQLHSIEQPIKQGQIEAMTALCDETPLPIALDEELIGVSSVTKKKELLQTVRPQYIILKPSLVGGFNGSEEWIKCAENIGAGWWITSALESNIGLNAIAQWTYTKQVTMPQGLGTGGLFTNNFDCPLEVSMGKLSYKGEQKWNFNFNQI